MHGNFRVTKLKVVSFQDITPFSGESQSAKTFCAQNHGVFRFSVGRCFFVLDHGYPGLNFSQQVELCGENGAVLSYPRSQEEVETIWEVFREHLESSGEKVTCAISQFMWDFNVELEGSISTRSPASMEC